MVRVSGGCEQGESVSEQSSPELPPAYGATPLRHGETIGQLGISAYARGNLLGYQDVAVRRGNLRLRTGQPSLRPVSGSRYGESPPTHGATLATLPYASPLRGISAYARGNHPSAFEPDLRIGNLRLRTGQPQRIGGSQRLHRESPPTHGATLQMGSGSGIISGISAYARGNLARAVH